VAESEIFIYGGYSPGDLGTEVPHWVQGLSIRRGQETKSPEAEAVCRHCLHILTAETMHQRLKISHNSPRHNSWQSVWRWVSDIARGLNPQANVWRPNCWAVLNIDPLSDIAYCLDVLSKRNTQPISTNEFVYSIMIHCRFVAAYRDT